MSRSKLACSQRTIMTGITAMLISAAPRIAFAQVLPRDTVAAPASAKSAPAGTGVISGTIVSADNGARPIRLANVVLIGAMTGTLRVTMTDDGGRFSVNGLPADRYVIGASKPPFLGAVAGATRPARPGAPVMLGDGQKIGDVVIRMPLGAAITGVITDERGQPGANVVMLLQQWRMQGGERALVSVPIGNIQTDDRGRYRAFGLPPGEYFLSAMRLGSFPSSVKPLTDAEVDNAIKGAPVPPSPPLSTDQALRYVPVFFPGTTRATDAAPITLTTGEERQNVDFRLESVRTAKLEGTVMTSDGQPVAAGSLLLSMLGPFSQVNVTRVLPDGHFSFPTVAPGSYSLLLNGSGPQAGQFATASIEVAGVDLTGVQLTMKPGLSFSGRLAFEGTAPPPAMAGRQIPLRALTPGLTGFASPQVAPTTATGAFVVSKISPGRYVLGGPLFFGATADSVTWALQSVVVDGRDVTDMPIDIASETAPKDVVVTFQDQWQSLSGTAAHTLGAVVTDDTIVLFPADKAYWIYGSRRILTTRPGNDGTFTFGGPGPISLAAGSYLLVAVKDIDKDEQFDPAFLASLTASATQVTIQPGEKKVQNLAIR